MKRLSRNEVPVEQTWDLSALFESESAWANELESVQSLYKALTQYQGILVSTPQTLYTALTELESASIKLIQLGTYANLKQSEDGTNPKNQENSMKFAAVSTQALSSITFFESEITSMTETEYSTFFAEYPDLQVFKNYLDDIYKQKNHRLSAESEKVIASLGEVLNAPYRIYSVSKAADMKFDNFGLESLPNSFALFENKYEFSSNRTLRESAYKSFSKTLESYKNTYAAVYAAEVKKHIAISRLRSYDSATEMLLEPQKVTLEMYNNQIDTIYKELAPHMQKFIKLKQKVLGIDKMKFYDLKAPLDETYNPPATIDSVKDTIIEALSVLGDDYKTFMIQAFEERWIDFSDNVGKSTGAFCASPYGVHPYILISYSDNMRSAFTLAHELGHAGHFSYANREQRVFNTRPSTYFIEAPSTMNEMLLANHLMKQTNEPRMKRWVIMQLMGTYYHNFVTHLLEAEFQRRIYQLAENNTSLTANVLCKVKLDVLRNFWGDAVDIDEEAGMTWMRQPHYYMGLYPYTYSAGLTISTALSQRIINGDENAISKWIEVLKSGGSKTPQELIAMVDMDMSTPDSIKQAVGHVGNLIDELETLFQ